MILNAKILTPSLSFHAVDYNEAKTQQFPAVDYNNDKTENPAPVPKARFLSCRNFPGGLAQTLDAQGLKDYLVCWGLTNTRVKQQQFHVAVTCKGKECTAQQLEQAAHLYMDKMGYSANPYLVYFHQDTGNNHVHIVSTRIGPDGKKINSDLEHQRSVKIINTIGEQITGKRNITFDKAVAEARAFRFTTPAQFNMLMERSGFDMQKTGTDYTYHRNGCLQGVIGHQDVQASLTEKNTIKADNQKRMAQIKAVMFKYACKHDPVPRLVHTAAAGGRPEGRLHYTSKLSEHLKQTFGIEFIFHASGEKPVYGYTLIDNVSKTVFKGSDIASLKELFQANNALQPAGHLDNPATPPSDANPPANPSSPGTEPASHAAHQTAAPSLLSQLHHNYTTYSNLGAIEPRSPDDRKKRLKRRR
jgi:hypothetical protein